MGLDDGDGAVGRHGEVVRSAEVASERSDRPVGLDDADTVVVLRDVQPARGVEAEPAGPAELGGGRFAAVAGEPACPVSGHAHRGACLEAHDVPPGDGVHDAVRIDRHPDGLAGAADGRDGACAEVDAHDAASVAVGDEERTALHGERVWAREDVRRRTADHERAEAIRPAREPRLQPPPARGQHHARTPAAVPHPSGREGTDAGAACHERRARGRPGHDERRGPRALRRRLCRHTREPDRRRRGSGDAGGGHGDEHCGCQGVAQLSFLPIGRLRALHRSRESRSVLGQVGRLIVSISDPSGAEESHAGVPRSV